MTNDQFQFQMHRLESAFGERHFPLERLELIWGLVAWMGLGQFSCVVDHMLSTMRYAPLPKDFKEASILEKKKAFENDVGGAIKALNTPWSGGLQAFLTKQYPGCKTLNEAVQVQILQNQVQRALNQ